MSNAAETLEAIIRHTDAGGVLYRTSPLVSTASVPDDANDPVSLALHDVLRELRTDGAQPIISPDAPVIVRARAVLAPSAVQPVPLARILRASSILDLSHGLHRDVPGSVYFERVEGVASKSLLDKIHRSPAHLRAYLDGGVDESTDAFTIGTAVHAALLEPERFLREYEMLPSFGDCRRKEPKANRDAWRKDHGWDEERECIPGVTLLTKDDFATVRGMVDSVHAHPLASRLLVGGEAEITMRWRDEATGIEMKGRADYYLPKLRTVVDVKTTEDARPSSFKKSVANYRYHVQQAIYEGGFEAVGEPLKRFVFLVVEKSAPFAISLFMLDAESVAKGRDDARADLDVFARCIETGEWPAYPTGIQTLELPGWAV